MEALKVFRGRIMAACFGVREEEMQKSEQLQKVVLARLMVQ